MKEAWANLTISTVTSRLMGTMFVNNRIQVQNVFMKIAIVVDQPSSNLR